MTHENTQEDPWETLELDPDVLRETTSPRISRTELPRKTKKPRRRRPWPMVLAGGVLVATLFYLKPWEARPMERLEVPWTVPRRVAVTSVLERLGWEAESGGVFGRMDLVDSKLFRRGSARVRVTMWRVSSAEMRRELGRKPYVVSLPEGVLELEGVRGVSAGELEALTQALRTYRELLEEAQVPPSLSAPGLV